MPSESVSRKHIPLAGDTADDQLPVAIVNADIAAGIAEC